MPQSADRLAALLVYSYPGSLARRIVFDLEARGPGFEPGLRDPKSLVLPLDDPRTHPQGQPRSFLTAGQERRKIASVSTSKIIATLVEPARLLRMGRAGLEPAAHGLKVRYSAT